MSAVTQALSSVAPPRLRKALVADLFCGAGGTSTGARMALRTLGWDMDLVAVNHCPVAIATHSRNHPKARHFCADLEALRPRDLVREGRLDLLTASPTCTFHSVARGGRPTSDQQRMDPWLLLRWVTELDVARLLVENVPEFVHWGPVDEPTGKPIKSRRGDYFRAWSAALEAVGFRLEWRVLNAADYGDATTRRRFFLMARSDGGRLVWPAATHANGGAGGLEPWRGASACIDWSVTGRSIYTRRKPLAPRSLRRIEAGLIKYRWPLRYLRRLQAHMAELGVQPRPVPQSPGGGGEAHPFMLSRLSTGAPRSVDCPTPTQVAKHSHILVTPYYSGGSGLTCTSGREPVPAIPTKARFGLVMPVTHDCDGNRARPASAPFPTITTASRGELALVTVADGADDDLLYRMLDVPELAAAMSFDAGDDAYEFVGTKTERIKQVGNAVPVRTARALVTAIMGV